MPGKHCTTGQEPINPLIQRGDAVPREEGRTPVHLRAPAVGLTDVLSLAPSALAHDEEAEIPRSSLIISFLMEALRSYPTSERLITVNYNVLSIISSQGVVAFCPWFLL